MALSRSSRTSARLIHESVADFYSYEAGDPNTTRARTPKPPGTDSVDTPLGGWCPSATALVRQSVRRQLSVLSKPSDYMGLDKNVVRSQLSALSISARAPASAGGGRGATAAFPGSGHGDRLPRDGARDVACRIGRPGNDLMASPGPWPRARRWDATQIRGLDHARIATAICTRRRDAALRCVQ
jgi:hypothetical protein